jgi:DNA polymerase III alpha subunit
MDLVVGAEDAGRRDDRPRQSVWRGRVLQHAKEKGVHPVIGCECTSRSRATSRSDTDRYNHLVLLCENQEGYRNLLKLVSTGFWKASTTSRASIRICWRGTPRA